MQAVLNGGIVGPLPMRYSTTYSCQSVPDLFRQPARFQIAAQFGRILESDGVLVTEALVDPRALKRAEGVWTPLASATERIAKAQTAGDSSRYKARQEELLALFRSLRALALRVEQGLACAPDREADVLALIAALGPSPTFDRLYLARFLVSRLLRQHQNPYAKALFVVSLARRNASPVLARVVDEMAADSMLSQRVLAGVTKAEKNVGEQLDSLLALLSGRGEAPKRDPLWTLFAERLGTDSEQLRRSVEHQVVVKLHGHEAFCENPDAALLRLEELTPRLLSGTLSSEMRPPIAAALVDRYCLSQNQGGSVGRRMALARVSAAAPDTYRRFLWDLSAGYGPSPAQADVVEAARKIGLDLSAVPGAAA